MVHNRLLMVTVPVLTNLRRTLGFLLIDRNFDHLGINQSQIAAEANGRRYR